MMGARWTDPRPTRHPALLESNRWTGTLALVVLLLMLAGALAVTVAH